MKNFSTSVAAMHQMVWTARSTRANDTVMFQGVWVTKEKSHQPPISNCLYVLSSQCGGNLRLVIIIAGRVSGRTAFSSNKAQVIENNAGPRQIFRKPLHKYAISEPQD